MSWSGRRESNPYHQLGRLRSYHYTTPAQTADGIFHGRSGVKSDPVAKGTFPSRRAESGHSSHAQTDLARSLKAGLHRLVECAVSLHDRTTAWRLSQTFRQVVAVFLRTTITTVDRSPVRLEVANCSRPPAYRPPGFQQDRRYRSRPAFRHLIGVHSAGGRKPLPKPVSEVSLIRREP